ncbi:FtsH protease activity modulator HflK [Oceanibaculum indicum]|uniref:Protein HflK n=1 Tax=Oceanibaculum indicum P24 TaxID=1207063 RepID=K2K933_9PROT|nr:FtsH protease activity modulator HflK [Oceanibaculum indicum]EKE73805.1 HflK protein [Oceanibaculum indicum P24]
MPWNSNQGGGQGGGPWGSGGGGGNGGSPWGRPGGGGGGGGGGPQPPNIEELIKKGQERFQNMMPGGFGNTKGIILVLLVAVALWGASGFYRVQPDEQGVVLRFGEWVRTTGPGLNYHLPTPIESVLTPNVTRENRIEIGFRSSGDSAGRAGVSRDDPEESLMLTGDENIVDIDFVVFWRIKDAGQFLFKLRNPDLTVKAVAESVMREIIGQTPIQVALTEGRQVIEVRATENAQRLLDDYQSGVEVRQIQLLAVDPPAPVVDAFNEVQRARADKERVRNEAEAYRNDIVPRARGDAERLIQEARAYREEVVNRSQGDAQRFLSVYEAYSKAPDVTQQRIYIETMQQILGNVQKVIIDDKDGGQGGVVPYLPLPEIQKRTGQGTSTAPAANRN